MSDADLDVAISSLEDYIDGWEKDRDDEEEPLSAELKLLIDKLIEDAKLEIAKLKHIRTIDEKARINYNKELDENLAEERRTNDKREPNPEDEFIQHW